MEELKVQLQAAEARIQSLELSASERDQNQNGRIAQLQQQVQQLERLVPRDAQSPEEIVMTTRDMSDLIEEYFECHQYLNTIECFQAEKMSKELLNDQSSTAKERPTVQRLLMCAFDEGNQAGFFAVRYGFSRSSIRSVSTN